MIATSLSRNALMLALALGAALPTASMAYTLRLVPVKISGGGIAAGPDGNIWIVDQTSDRIVKVTPQGTPTYYVLPTENAHMSGIVAGADGALWFSESKADKIGRIDIAGNISEFKLPQYSFPTAMVNGPDGNVWATLAVGKGIARIATDGQYRIFNYGSEQMPSGIAVGPDGNLWFTVLGDNAIYRMTSSGVASKFPIPWSNTQPKDIVAGKDGRLWFTMSAIRAVGALDLAGHFEKFDLASPGDFAEHLVLGNDGKVWASSTSANRLVSVAPNGVAQQFNTAVMQNADFDYVPSPAAMTLGPDNKIWFIGNSGIGLGVLDDDSFHRRFNFGADSITVGSGTSSINLTVSRSGDVSAAASVNYFTQDGLAKAGVDYVAQSGQLLFAAGESSKTVTVQLLSHATNGNAEFSVQLAAPSTGMELGGTAKEIVIMPSGNSATSGNVPATSTDGGSGGGGCTVGATTGADMSLLALLGIASVGLLLRRRRNI